MLSLCLCLQKKKILQSFFKFYNQYEYTLLVAVFFIYYIKSVPLQLISVLFSLSFFTEPKKLSRFLGLVSYKTLYNNLQLQFLLKVVTFSFDLYTQILIPSVFRVHTARPV